MPSPEGDKRGNAIPESRTQDVEATDDIIVHGSHPSFGVVWLSLLLALRQLPFFFNTLRCHCTKSTFPQCLPMGFPSRGKAFLKSIIAHAELTLSCFRFSSSCLGEPDYPTDSRIIHRKLRQQSEGILSCYRGIGYRPSTTATLTNDIRLTAQRAGTITYFSAEPPSFPVPEAFSRSIP